MPGDRAEPRLLVRDLAQVATPPAGHGPHRGRALGGGRGDRRCLRPLCGRPHRGRGPDARPAAPRRRGRGARRLGALRNPGTRRLPHASRLGRRSRRGVLAPRGRGELRGAARGRRRDPLDRSRNPRSRRRRPAARESSATRPGCSATARRPGRASPGYGLDRETELASLRAVAAAGGSPTWLGAHSVPPEYPSADAYLDFALARRAARSCAGSQTAADVFLERGAFDAAQARRYLLACREAGLALRLHGDQFTESGAIPLAIELGARSVDHLEATKPAGARALAASDVVGVLLPACALFLDRPMPPARALADARRGSCARDRLQSGELVHAPACRSSARSRARRCT